jgi:hypothetical protein
MSGAWHELILAVMEANVIVIGARRSRVRCTGHRSATERRKGRERPKSAAMLNLYDHEVPVVQPAGAGDL